MPREEKRDRRASLRDEPTPITHGATAYGFSESGEGPWLPAANTTVIPASCTSRVAMFTGSSGSNQPWVPHEQFTTRTL